MDGLNRAFSETATLKAEKEMMGAFQEMKQADTLVKKGVYKEAEQLYSRVHDIVASFSPKNSPMMDVINRKKLGLFYRSNKPKEVKALISEMTKNVDSRGDADERILERMEFVNVLLHMKNTADCAPIVKELSSLCANRKDVIGLTSSLFSSLYNHLTGGDKVYEMMDSLLPVAKSISDECELRVLNNTIAIRWDEDAEPEATLALCKRVHDLAQEMEAKLELTDANEATVRQALNNAGAFDLFKEKVEEGGAALKYALKLSDNRGIRINENVVSSNTLGSIASILLKQDQPVVCEGLYLQALEFFTKKEKAVSLNGFSCEEVFDYSKVCDGYAHLLLKWEKREPLGEKYQQQAVDLLMKLNENADWMFPLTSRFWTPALFNWGRDL
ncbi:hypothetical protein AV274_4881 [Blastocystis sp. ATCC 50177/Nand II]|uniref:Uncharacterized protein n=1 Tax=Blastocystis sp. subtype 1 (strain ATCC 50177 / NandII) TaxID=478820 RepID=A0A196SAT0_BLAHN|nr:hypothetical protein AV274_4881 [Blastocystis sp. ATCC 50177/Nand II]